MRNLAVRELGAVLLAGLFSWSAQAASGPAALVDRALKAEGGAAAWAGVSTYAVKASGKYWEPDQSVVPGGEPRYVGEATFETLSQVNGLRSRTERDAQLVYPGKREYRYTEIVFGAEGYVRGLDTTGPTRQTRASPLAAHAMSRFRVLAYQRELARSSPALVIAMHRNPRLVRAMPDTQVGGRSLPTVMYRSSAGDLIVMFDRQTGLPARVRSLDYDSLRGDVDYDLVLSDWRQEGPVRAAHRLVYQLNGITVADVSIQSLALGAPVPSGALDIPPGQRLKAAPSAGPVPFQWVIRRQNMGTFIDTDQLSYDPAASRGLHLERIGDGVELVQGGSHNSLVVEMKDFLVVVEAPVDDRHALWLLEALRRAHPDKPVKYLVLTHHHLDHSSGLRSYVRAGAILAVAQGDEAFFRQVLNSPHTRNAPVPEPVGAGARILEVGPQPLSITDGSREVKLYPIANPHVQGMLMGYLPDQRLGFVADLWSPGRDPLGTKPSPGEAAVVAAVRQYGLDPLRFAGAHGSVADYADLAKIATP